MWARKLEISDTIIRKTKCTLAQPMQRLRSYYTGGKEASF